MEGGALFHKCKNNGICEFETDSFGNTFFSCRKCGEKFGLPELTREIAQYYITPAF
jgi:tRNA(Ile2) C34 agmatinyltransferase TiaS